MDTVDGGRVCPRLEISRRRIDKLPKQGDLWFLLLNKIKEEVRVVFSLSTNMFFTSLLSFLFFYEVLC